MKEGRQKERKEERKKGRKGDRKKGREEERKRRSGGLQTGRKDIRTKLQHVRKNNRMQ